MKSPQILSMLTLCLLLAFACKQAQGPKPGDDNHTPPNEPIPMRILHDSLLKKQQKPKKVDTLLPKIARL